MIAKFKQEVKNFDGTRLAIAFADISFAFPKDTLYPNLCVKHDKYGLQNPLQGRTVATITEVHLALYLGATITYHEAFVAESVDKNSYVFRDHLGALVEKRDEAKKEKKELEQQMMKLYVNTLYGKVAQGITPKKGYDLRQEDTKELGISPVTQAYFASMITGTLRAGLSALLVVMDELNKEGYNYIPISATTDGILYKVGDASKCFKDCLQPEYQSDVWESLKQGDKHFATFEKVDPVLYAKLQTFPVLRLLQQSRKAWGKDEYIEIKHAVNHVLNIKTRGQIGVYHEN